MLEAKGLEAGAREEARWDGRDFDALGSADRSRYLDRFADGVTAYLEAVGREPVSFANGPVMAQLTYGEFVSWIADRMVYVHGENQNYDYILRLREIAAWLTSARSALEAETGGGEAAYDPCGGCGNADPDNRCLGCMHPFVATTTDARAVEEAKRRYPAPIAPADLPRDIKNWTDGALLAALAQGESR